MGYVYIIEDEIGRVKIGRSKSPKSRVLNIKRTIGMNLKNVYISEGIKNYDEIENITIKAFLEKIILDIGIEKGAFKSERQKLWPINVLINIKLKKRFHVFCNANKIEIDDAIEKAIVSLMEHYDNKLNEVI